LQYITMGVISPGHDDRFPSASQARSPTEKYAVRVGTRNHARFRAKDSPNGCTGNLSSKFREWLGPTDRIRFRNLLDTSQIKRKRLHRADNYWYVDTEECHES